jgi:hypothetical protein
LKCFTDVREPTNNAHGVLEERDPSYEEMLKHMVGRITTKPGGKPEMGDVSLLIPKCSPFVNKMLEEGMLATIIYLNHENSIIPSQILIW